MTNATTQDLQNLRNELYALMNQRSAYAPSLLAIAGLAVTDSNMIVGNGTTWVAESGATARTSLGLAIGTNVQAWDANLDQIAALVPTDSYIIVGDGSAWVRETGATARTSLGLGAGDTPTFTSLGLTGAIVATNGSTPTDFTVTCGAAKTLVLTTVVYDDLQFPTDVGKVPAVANYPDWIALTTNCSEFAFDVDDYIDLQSNEVPHNWSEGTAGDLHLHLATEDANATGENRFAKFTVYAALSDWSQAGTKVWTEIGPYTQEITIPTGTAASTGLYLDMGDMTLTGYKIGTQVKLRIKRIAATGGTEYDSRVFVTQAGIHLRRDTLGSRNEVTK